MTKACTKCGVVKPLDAFPKNRKMHCGYDSWCNPCRTAVRKTRRAENPEVLAADRERGRIYERTKRAKKEERRAYSAKRRAEPGYLEALREKGRKRRADPKVKAADAEYRARLRSNPLAAESLREAHRRYVSQPEVIERRRERGRTAYRGDPAKYLAKNAARRAAQLKATPAWANLDIVAGYYMLAAAMSRAGDVQYHVDHIEPLCGKHVCGLHCEFNLQVLPAKINIAKNNHMVDVVGIR